MPRAFALGLLVLLAGGLVYLLAVGGGTPPVDDVDLVRADPPEVDPPGDRELGGGTSLQGTPEAAEGPSRTGPQWPVVPSDRIPRGTLEVVPYGPDLEPLAADGVRMRLERVGAAFWSAPLGYPDAETSVWTFPKVPHGKVVVHVWGDHLLHTTKEAVVKADRTERVEVFLDRAGAIAFKATLPDDQAPETVKLVLRSARTDRPVTVHFQSRRYDLHTTDVRGKQATLGPEGVLFAVPAGRYVLQGESAEGDRVSREVEVGLGETVEVELPFAY